jgi:hypothetical protein
MLKITLTTYNGLYILSVSHTSFVVRWALTRLLSFLKETKWAYVDFKEI